MTDPPQRPPHGRAVRVTEILDDGVSVRRVRKLQITVSTAGGRPTVYTFAQDEINVGSDPDGDVPVADPSVSHEHLSIRLLSDRFVLTDRGSTNGTWVGELEVERVSISAELVVRIGKTLLTLLPLHETAIHELSRKPEFGRLHGASASMREMFALLERVAASDLTVLIEGETGTGKELVAEGLHDKSGLPGAFVAVNCGAIPKELLESELFGHERGAFTGAVKERLGAFLSADRGTLFLDEVGELPLDMQAKLLRAIERREVKPVGKDKSVPVAVRILAATHRNLVKEVKAGNFRQDLYYRLAVVTVKIPPLRNRLEDLDLLVTQIWDELARRREAMGLPKPYAMDATSLAMLKRYDFPGNVRELRNIIERWAVLGSSEAPIVSTEESPASRKAAPSGGEFDAFLGLPYHEARDLLSERFERAYVRAILDRAGGNVSKAAREAGVDRRHLQRWMARFGLRGEG